MAPAANESKPMYQKDEKALCFHGELLYEAKVLEVRRQDPKDKTSAHEYRVHYKGWKNTWDDWVPQDRLRKLTDDNKELAANLRRELTQQSAPKSIGKPTTGSKSRKQGSELGSGRGSEERHSSVPAGGRGTKRGRDHDIEKVGAPSVLPPTRDWLLLRECNCINLRDPILWTGKFLALTKIFDKKNDAATSNPGNSSSIVILRAYPMENKETPIPAPTGSKSRKVPIVTENEPARSTRTLRSTTQEQRRPSPDPNIRSRGGKDKHTNNDSTDPPGSVIWGDYWNTNHDHLTVDEILQRPPPPDEPERISTTTAQRKPQRFWTSLIGGSTLEEKHRIQEELVATGKVLPENANRHPQYVRTLAEHPGNSAKLQYYEGADPRFKIPIAGVPKGVHTRQTSTSESGPASTDPCDNTNLAAETDPPAHVPVSFGSLAYQGHSEQEETFHLRPSIRITIPDHLKNLLVDDWENVTKSLLLVPLPSQAPANFIIDCYFNEEKLNRRLGSAEADVLEEFCAGMKVYFEKSVGKILLYRFERAQLAEVRKMWESGKYPDWEGKGPGDCYGAEHLCRMLVNMPEMIAQTNLDAQSVARLKEEISKFCTWLARNSQRFFCAKYEKPSTEYIESAR